MKTILILFLACILAPAIYGQQTNSKAKSTKTKPVRDPAKKYELTTPIGPHHTITNSEVRIELDSQGFYVTRTQKVVRLASGLNYLDGGVWKASQNLIQIEGNQAFARNGSIKAKFEANITMPSTVELTGPDGKQLKSQLLGLSYWDPAAGRSVLFARMKSSIGEVLPPNQVIYRDAFEGVRADVLFTWKMGSFEQDVILRESPPTPADYGFSEETQMQVWTEFLNPPVPTKKTTRYVTKTRGNAGIRTGSVQATNRTTGRISQIGLVNEQLSFGQMKMPIGKAFELGGKVQGTEAASKGANVKSVIVAKQWMNLQGRTYLVESVEFASVKAGLNELKRTTANIAPSNAQTYAGMKPPAPPRIDNGQTLDAIRMAANNSNFGEKGYVLDYVVELDGGEDYMSFQNGTTYHLTGYFWVNSLDLEGGAIVKFDPGTTLEVDQDIWQWNTGTPAYFVAAPDARFGDSVYSPMHTGEYWASAALNLRMEEVDLTNLEIRNANIGLHSLYWGDYYDEEENYHGIGWHTLANSTIISSDTAAVADGTVELALDTIVLCDVNTNYITLETSTVYPNAITTCSPYCAGDLQPNTVAGATTLAINTSTNATFNCIGDQDMFKLVISSTSSLVAFTTGTNDTYGYLLDTNGTVLLQDDNSGSSPNFRFYWTANPGTYYIRVRHADRFGGTGNYSLTVGDCVGTPTILPSAGSYTLPTIVTITTTTAGSSIFYTKDGSQPGTNSIPYDNSGAFLMASSMTIKAFATKSGMLDSSLNSSVFTFPTTTTSNLFNVNFGATYNSQYNKTGIAAMGMSGSDYWNNTMYGDTYTGLKWMNSASSPITMVVQGVSGSWGNACNDPMFSIYNFTAGANITVTLTGLSEGSYDMYIYGHGAATAQNGNYSVTGGGVSWGSKSTASNVTDYNNPLWVENQQYVKDSAKPLAPSSSLVITVTPASDNYTVISGLQLLKLPATIQVSTADSDNDGLPDVWEFLHFGNLSQSATGDFDGDGVSNLIEYYAGTNPASSANLGLEVFTQLR